MFYYIQRPRFACFVCVSFSLLFSPQSPLRPLPFGPGEITPDTHHLVHCCRSWSALSRPLIYFLQLPELNRYISEGGGWSVFICQNVGFLTGIAIMLVIAIYESHWGQQTTGAWSLGRGTIRRWFIQAEIRYTFVKCRAGIKCRKLLKKIIGYLSYKLQLISFDWADKVFSGCMN